MQRPADLLEAVDAKPLDPAGNEDADFLRIAGWRTMFRLVPGAVLFRGLVLKVYRRSVETDQVRFEKLVKTCPELAGVQQRIARAIRTVAAFDPWYAFSLTLGRTGGEFASAIAIAVSVVDTLRTPTTAASGAEVAAIAAIVALRYITGLPTTWRTRVLYAIALLIAVAVVAPLSWGTVFGSAPLLGIEIFAVLRLASALAAYAILTAATRYKTSRYPEHEVTQSFIIAATAARNPQSFRRPVDRRMLIADFEWIALRLENEFVGRLLLGDDATNAWLRQRGAECAAAVRRREKEIAFPVRDVPAAVAQFAVDCLLCAGRASWGSFPREEVVVSPRRRRILDVLRGAAQVVMPALAAVAAYYAIRQFGGTTGEELAPKILAAGLGFTFVSLLAAIDPQRFDAKVGAARALGEIAK